jgi:cell division protein ZapA
MPEVNLMIHGRSYGVGCDDGQEKRVRELGQYIDKRMQEIASVSGGIASESHLMLLATLMLTDELFETREGTQGLRNQLAQVSKANETLQRQMAAQANSNQEQGLDADTEAQIAGAIEHLAGRLESIAKKLQVA